MCRIFCNLIENWQGLPLAEMLVLSQMELDPLAGLLVEHLDLCPWQVVGDSADLHRDALLGLQLACDHIKRPLLHL